MEPCYESYATKIEKENARLRAELKVSRKATEQTTLDLIEQCAENARLRAELEAAKRDIRDMLRESRLLSDYDLCVWCERWSDPHEMCYARDCEIECKWRGLCAENGGTK